MSPSKTFKISRVPAAVALDDPIAAFLRPLPHTGRAGFEGLVAYLLQQQLGQRFRMAASGPQEGMDAQAEPGPAGANLIKVEAKHYFRSELSLRELTAEIVQACRDDGCDLWVLACTCAVSTQIAALEKEAQKHGAECVFLDRPNSGIDRLAILMATHEESVFLWASRAGATVDEPALRVAFTEIKTRSEYEETKAQLATKLASTLVGYVDASRRAGREFLSVLADSRTSESLFNQNVAVLAGEVRRIRRTSVESAFDEWWRGGKPASPHLAVLGEEGQGKTWALMGWLADLARSDELPLLLSCNSSVDIQRGDTLEDLLPKLLKTWTGLKTIDWWTTRLSHWIARPKSGSPPILIVVDGLNENAAINWVDFFRPVLHKRWEGKVAVIATDRPVHWESHKRLVQDGFGSITVRGYSNTELQEALASHPQIALKEIPVELHALLRTPRYCELVAQHFEALSESGDFTPERLILLDAAHRKYHKRNFPLGEQSLIDVIQALARRYRENSSLDAQAVKALLPHCEDPLQVLQEISDGGLLVSEQQGAGRRFRVEKSRLIFGLGMLLAEDVWQHYATETSASVVAEFISGWLEPHAEMDLKVQICAAAVYHSYLDAKFPSGGRRELIKHWLTSRNAWLEHDEARLSLVLKGPEDFIEVAQSLWGSDTHRGTAQEFLGAALCRYRDHELLEPHLKRAVSRWMGHAHAAGQRLMRGHTEEDQQRRVGEIALRAGQVVVPGPMTYLGETLTIVEDEGLLRLSRLGLRIMSAGSLLPYASGLVTWAAAAALMGGTLEFDEVAWIIRLAEDDLEPLLLPATERFLASETAGAHLAGRYLADALGTTTAKQLRAQHPGAEDPIHLQRLAEHRANPCESYYAWSLRECEECLARETVPVHLLLDRAKLQLLDPARPQNARVAEFLRNGLVSLSPDRLRTNLSASSDDNHLTRILPVAAAHAPDALAAFMRSAIRGMPAREWTAQRFLSFKLPQYVPLMHREEIGALQAALSAQRSTSAEWQGRNFDHHAQMAEGFTTLALLPLLNPTERWTEILGRPSKACDLDNLALCFEAVTQLEFEAGFKKLAVSVDRLEITRLLWLLGSGKGVLSDEYRQLLIGLWGHENAIVRGMVARCAVLLGDSSLGQELLKTLRRIDEDTHRWEAQWYFALLEEYCACLSFEEVMVRVDPAAAGFLLKARNLPDAEVEMYANCLSHLWTDTVGAAEPKEQIALPEISADPTPERSPTASPEPIREESSSWHLKDPSTSWKDGADGLPPLDEDPDQQFEARITRFNAGRDAILAAWKTEALHWFGRSFSVDTLHAVAKSKPELCRQWIAEASLPGVEGKRVRIRMGSFLATLCEALVSVDHAVAIKFLNDFLADDAYVRFSVSEMLFRLPRSKAVDDIRAQRRDQMTSDEDLAHFTFLAQAAEDGWLQESIEELIKSARLAQRARGLAMASFSHLPETEFEDLIKRAKITGTWVETAALESFRANHIRDRYGSIWFGRFMLEEDQDRSWAAIQVANYLADERWYLWESRTPKDAPRWRERLAYIQTNWQDIKRDLRRQKERDARLFGIKTPKGEIFPF